MFAMLLQILGHHGGSRKKAGHRKQKRGALLTDWPGADHGTLTVAAAAALFEYAARSCPRRGGHFSIDAKGVINPLSGRLNGTLLRRDATGYRERGPRVQHVYMMIDAPRRVGAGEFMR